MAVICNYALYKTFDYKGKRINDVCQHIDLMEKDIDEGKIKLNDLSDRLYAKADFTIKWEPYTEQDIPFKKGSYDYWITQKQLDPQNRINEMATKYMILFYLTLNELYGFGKERLNRVQNEVYKMLERYQDDKVSVREWRLTLLDDAGVWFEDPIDPLTQGKGSVMTGGGI